MLLHIHFTCHCSSNGCPFRVHMQSLFFDDDCICIWNGESATINDAKGFSRHEEAMGAEASRIMAEEIRYGHGHQGGWTLQSDQPRHPWAFQVFRTLNCFTPIVATLAFVVLTKNNENGWLRKWTKEHAYFILHCTFPRTCQFCVHKRRHTYNLFGLLSFSFVNGLFLGVRIVHPMQRAWVYLRI